MANWRTAALSVIRLAMLSVLIETKNDEEGLARTLASLVGGAVEGVVREVIVCDGGSTDHTLRVAEHAGCHVVTQGLAVAVAQAKGDWLLMLEPGARPADGWIEAVLDHVARQQGPAKFERDEKLPLLKRLFGVARPLAQGLLIRKSEAAQKQAGNGAELARMVSAKVLRAKIRVAG